MASTKYQPLTEERLDALRRDADVVYHRRTEESPTPFVSALRVTGYIDTIDLLGRRDEEESNPTRRSATNVSDILKHEE